MRILFWGTPSYAVASLEALIGAGHELVGIVSQPDRRRGRGGAASPSAVKRRGLELGLPVFTPERISRDPLAQAQLAALGAEVYVVVAFGQILPPEVLAQPPLGCWNGHASLLPRWRGAAPIQWALLEGDQETGVGIMAMEAGLDTGPVLLERRLPIGLLENAEQVATRLAALTGELLVEAMALIVDAGGAEAADRLVRLGLRTQSEVGMTYARQLTKEDFRLNLELPALVIHRRVMGLYPDAVSRWKGQLLKLIATEPLERTITDQLSKEGAALVARLAAEGEPAAGGPSKVEPGTVLEVVPGLGLVVATGSCPLLLRCGQLEGRKALEGDALIQQLGAVAGDRIS